MTEMTEEEAVGMMVEEMKQLQGEIESPPYDTDAYWAVHTVVTDTIAHEGGEAWAPEWALTAQKRLLAEFRRARAAGELDTDKER